MTIQQIPRSPFRHSSSHGFTLVELTVAALIAGLVLVVGGSAMVNDLRDNARTQAMQRKRDAWKRTINFVESEIAIAERIISNVASIPVPASCSFDADDQVRMVIDPGQDFHLIIYAVREHSNLPDNEKREWKPDLVLKRCGPPISSGIENNVYLSGPPTSSILVDELQGSTGSPCPGSGSPAQYGFCVDPIASDSLGKYVSFNLMFKGLNNVLYGSGSSTYSRINPIQSSPSLQSACDRYCLEPGCADYRGSYKVFAGSSLGPNPLVATYTPADIGKKAMVCGLGFASSLQGSSGFISNIIDPGNRAGATISLNEPDCRDNFLYGTTQNDSIKGGCGNDFLIGRGGGDTLVGGGGDDQFRPWSDDNNNINNTVVTGGAGGFDILFLAKAKASFSDPTGCTSTSSCTITTSTASNQSVTLTITNINRIIFNDTILDLP